MSTSRQQAATDAALSAIRGISVADWFEPEWEMRATRDAARAFRSAWGAPSGEGLARAVTLNARQAVQELLTGLRREAARKHAAAPADVIQDAGATELTEVLLETLCRASGLGKRVTVFAHPVQEHAYRTSGGLIRRIRRNPDTLGAGFKEEDEEGRRWVISRDYPPSVVRVVEGERSGVLRGLRYSVAFT